MKLKAITVLVLVFGLVAFAWADDKALPTETEGARGSGVCPLDGYVGYTSVEGLLLVTDVDYMLGPLATDNDGTTYLDVILDLDIAQTWVGDLVVELFYDADCDGTPELGPVSALCRPGFDGCDFPDGCCGCSGNIAGHYLFSDGGDEPLGEFDCPTDILEGCYLAAIESPDLFSIFDGLSNGGCFWLRIGDAAAGDDTTLNSWTVWVLPEGATPTIEATWGQVKSIYR